MHVVSVFVFVFVENFLALCTIFTFSRDIPSVRNTEVMQPKMALYLSYFLSPGELQYTSFE